MNPTISIIIPVHHAEETLAGAVQSVGRQDIVRRFPDVRLELILVDDGTTEQKALQQAKERCLTALVKILYIQDAGVSESRNRGLQASAGDLITFLDADDAMEPSMLGDLYALYLETGAQICGCGFCSVTPGEAAEYAGAGRRPEDPAACESPLPATLLAGSRILQDAVLQGDTRVWSKLFQRDFIGEKRFQKGLTIGEDLLFVTSLIRPDTRYALISSPLYRYTRNPKGVMERPFTRSYMDQLRCYEEAERVIRSNMPELLEDAAARRSLRRLQMISDVLTAMKIARLPREEFQNFRQEFARCRRTLAGYSREPGIASVLPGDYRLKSFLLRYLPAAFCIVMRMTAAGKGTERSA